MEFWIDVGGTFSDCIGCLDDGSIVRRKVLSSGVTKGRAGEGSDRGRIVDLSRCADPSGFWHGYLLQLLDHNGRTVGESPVARFDATVCALELASPLRDAPLPGQAYELSSGEESPILAIRYSLGLALDAPLPPLSVRL